MPRLVAAPFDGTIPKEERLKRVVERLLRGKNAADYVVALTDVYTGTNDFKDAADAKCKMLNWCDNNKRFIPHAAQYEFEAWLLPYWDRIKRLAGTNKTCPGSSPEAVNHSRPPSKYLEEVYRTGGRGIGYAKPVDAMKILEGQDLDVAAKACPELRAFLDTLIRLSTEETA